MQKTIAFSLALLMVLPAAFGQQNLASQITAIPVGTKIELRLKNKQTVRGVRGQLSNVGFMLVDDRTGERQIAFDEVVSVKRYKTHPIRNTLIVVGILFSSHWGSSAVAFRCERITAIEKLAGSSTRLLAPCSVYRSCPLAKSGLSQNGPTGPRLAAQLKESPRAVSETVRRDAVGARRDAERRTVFDRAT